MENKIPEWSAAERNAHIDASMRAAELRQKQASQDATAIFVTFAAVATVIIVVFRIDVEWLLGWLIVVGGALILIGFVVFNLPEAIQERRQRRGRD